MPKLAACNIL